MAWLLSLWPLWCGRHGNTATRPPSNCGGAAAMVLGWWWLHLSSKWWWWERRSLPQTINTSYGNGDRGQKHQEGRRRTEEHQPARDRLWAIVPHPGNSAAANKQLMGSDYASCTAAFTFTFACFIIFYCCRQKLDDAVSLDWEHISFWAVCCGWGLAFSFPQPSCLPCFHNQKQQLRSYFCITLLCCVELMSAEVHLSNCTHTHTIHVNVYIFAYIPNPLLFAAHKLSMCLQLTDVLSV